MSAKMCSRASRSKPSSGGRETAGVLDLLTDSELEVLEGLGEGKSPEEIAGELNVSGALVDAQTASIRRKLKLKNDNALIRYAVCWVEDSRK